VDFLQEFQINSLLVNVNLDFHHCTADDVLAFLTKILPMITSINSVTALGQTRTYNLLGLLENKFPSLSKRMLTSARILNTWSADLSTAGRCQFSEKRKISDFPKKIQIGLFSEKGKIK
jgi:hypothetical protein